MTLVASAAKVGCQEMRTGLNSNLAHLVNLLQIPVAEYMLLDPRILVKHSSVIGRLTLEFQTG